MDNRELAKLYIAEAMQTIKGKNYDYLYSLYEQKQKEIENLQEELQKQKNREFKLGMDCFMCGVIIGVVICAIITELLVK